MTTVPKASRRAGPPAQDPRGRGFLAIWSDLSPEDETDWTHWMMREHAIERVRVDGFLACRIYRALGVGGQRRFILYDLERPEVVDAPHYLARLDAPTPWSRRIMPRLGNFVRGGGAVAAAAGRGQGGIVGVIPWRRDTPLDPGDVCTDLAALDRIAAARVLLTEPGRTSVPTTEKRMRSGDGSFEGLLLVEGFDETAVGDALGRLGPAVSPLGAVELYALCFHLQRDHVPG